MLARLDWGSVPAWIALLGAFVAAAAFVSGRLDAAKSQARSIYVMVMAALPSGTGSREAPHTVIELHNDSDFPIVDVGVTEWEWGKRLRRWRLRPQAKWWTTEVACGFMYSTVLPNSKIKEDDLMPVKGNPPPGSPSLNPPIMLTFRDASGRRWVRWPDGKLSRRWPSR